MAKLIPKWLLKHYCKLYRLFQEEEFRLEEALGIFKNEKNLNVFLSMLSRAGWLERRMDHKDSRKRIYKLISPIDIITDIEINNKNE